MNPDPNPPSTADPVGRELMRQGQLISQLRQDLDELSHSTTDITADLIARLEEISQGGSPTIAPRPWCWRQIGPQAARELWRQLTEWVTWLRARYPLAKKIPPCWSEHPEVVEEMTAAWLAWQDAYENPNASLTAGAEWHDRWLPGLLQRLEHGPHALNCDDEHRSRPSPTYARDGRS